MAQILVRNLDEKVVESLKEHARADGRSLQSEVKAILEQAVREPRVDMESAKRILEGFRKRFKGRTFSNSTELIREDRER